MAQSWREEDPGLPIAFGQCSNGEYEPEPITPVRREAENLARAGVDDAIARTGMSRRQFLRSASALAVSLAAIDAAVARAAGLPIGLWYPFDPTSRHDADAARAVLGPSQFVFDVQGHLLEYDLDPSTRGDWFWGRQFPQAQCQDEDDPRACFAMNHFLEEVFVRSDTTMVALSGLPILPEGSPLSPQVMEETRRLVQNLSGDDRVVVNALALPQIAPITSVLEEMEHTVLENQIAGWKTFTHFPTGIHWWLDDHNPDLPQVGNVFLDQIESLGNPVLFVHKGLSDRARYGSPEDIGPAARAHPNVKFVVYHSGFEVAQREGPFTEGTAGVGVNRLLASVRGAGIGPGENVYAEIGSTWWHLLRRPDEAAHVLGKLLVTFGEDNVLWGTDSIFYGSPQGQIDAFRAFQIPAGLREQYGYPELTRAVKAKILGWNAANLYGIDPIREPVGFTADELEAARIEHPVPTMTWGPSTTDEVREFRLHHQGWP
jgi:hypothetical protein